MNVRAPTFVSGGSARPRLPAKWFHPRFEEPCATCDGCGVVTIRWPDRDFDEDSDRRKCRKCHGRGALLTEEGETLLRFLHRYAEAKP